MSMPPYLAPSAGTTAMLKQVAAALPAINAQIQDVANMLDAAVHAGVDVADLRTQLADLRRQHDRWIATLDAYGIAHG